MEIRNAVRACCALLAVGAAPAYGQAQFMVTDIGTLGGWRTEGLAMNEYGQVSGQATRPDGWPTAFFWDGTSLRDIGADSRNDSGMALNDLGQVVLQSGYRWTAGALEPLTRPPGAQVQPARINASGVVVASVVVPSRYVRPMRWFGGVPTELAVHGQAMDVNDAGQVAGNALMPNGRYSSVIWTDGVPRALDAPPETTGGNAMRINASGQAVGYAAAAGLVMPLRWSASGFERLGMAGGHSVTNLALNDSGQAIATLWRSDGIHAVLWNAGTVEPMLLTPGFISGAKDINASGNVVGEVHWGTPGTFRFETFLWNGRLRILADALDPADPLRGEVRLVYAVAVNDSDQVLATGFLRSNPDVTRTFVLTPRIPRFAFGGFLPPIDASGTNVAKAGSAVPVKFSLGGYRGPDVFAPGYPRVAACGPSGGGAPAATPGKSGLSYDTGSDTYTFVWKTEKAWAYSCRRLEVAFVDETPVRTVQFQLR